MYDFQKVALHALDRLQERTMLDPALIPLLQAEAGRVSEFVSPGHYYLPLHQDGRGAGYAAFKTVDTAKGPKLVLATVLAPHMRPRGENLSHLMLQPEASKAAADETPDQTYSPENMRFLKQRFTRLQAQLHENGAYTGTGHQRIVIPKSILTEKDILQLGFKPVKIAIPESGQDQSDSFRHPDNLFHIHSHPEGWTLHEDAHPAATMLATKVTSPLDKIKTYFQGIPHVMTEGVPGLFYYAKDQASQATPLAKKVLEEMHAQGVDLYGHMQNWKMSPTFAPPPETQQELKAAAERIIGGRANGKPDSDFDAKEIAKGMKVEREHSPDPEIQKEIAKDHLTESPRYYIELDKMEKKLKEKSAEVVAAFRTSKDGRKKWRVDDNDAKLTCTCPDYVYRHAGKGTHCKHIKQHLESQGSSMQKAAFTKEAVGTRLLGRMLDATGSVAKETSITRGRMAQDLLHWLRPMREMREPVLNAMHAGQKTPSIVMGMNELLAHLSPRREWATWMKPVNTGLQQAFVTDTRGSLAEMAAAAKAHPQHRKMIAAEATRLRSVAHINETALATHSSGRHSPQDVVQLNSIQTATPESVTREPGFNARRYAYKGGVPINLPANEPQWMTAIPSVAAGYAQSGHADNWGQSRLRVFDATKLRDAGPWTHHIATDPRGALGRLRLMAASFRLRPKIPNAGGSLVGTSPYYERVVGGQQAEPLATYKPIAPEDGIYMRVRGKTNPLAPGVKTASLVALRNRGLLLKEAALLTDLKPHQQRVVDRMEDPEQKGLVIVHGLGSGKTLTSLAVADRLGLSADVVTPAALQENYRKEVAKHLDKPFPINLQSLEATARNGGQSLLNPLLIVDEAHRLRNPGKAQKAFMDAGAQKRLLLTGSLMYNHPADMAAPINIAAGETVLPAKSSDFESRYIHERRIDPGFFGSLVGKPGETRLEIPEHRKPELKKILQKYVDYHPGSTEGFPTTEEQQIKVPMTERQRKIYDTVIKAAPPWVAQKIRSNMPPTKSEAKELNTFLTGIRQVSNSTAAYDTKHAPEHPKIDKAVQELQGLLEKNPKAKAIIYSNFLPSGINPYRERIKSLGIPYGEFTGEMPRSQREQLVRDYNDNKLKALLLSSAGGEGLDLKGTSLIQLLEPHWNEEKLKQVIGRGIRYKSHDDLPPEERKVLIQRFLATRPRAGVLEKMHLRDPGASVDEFLHGMGQRKEQIKNEFKKLLPKD